MIEVTVVVFMVQLVAVQGGDAVAMLWCWLGVMDGVMVLSDLGLEDVDRQSVDKKAAEHHALEIYRRMIDKVSRKAADEKKKKENDLKKRRRCPRSWKMLSLEISKISVIRKVIKEEQGDSNMGVESNDGDVVKDIEKAADAFA